MLRNFDVRSWPVSWKAPLLAAGLMIAAATMVSQVVMSRLAADQRTNLQALTEGNRGKFLGGGGVPKGGGCDSLRSCRIFLLIRLKD